MTEPTPPVTAVRMRRIDRCPDDEIDTMRTEFYPWSDGMARDADPTYGRIDRDLQWDAYRVCSNDFEHPITSIAQLVAVESTLQSRRGPKRDAENILTAGAPEHPLPSSVSTVIKDSGAPLDGPAAMTAAEATERLRDAFELHRNAGRPATWRQRIAARFYADEHSATLRTGGVVFILFAVLVAALCCAGLVVLLHGLGLVK